MSHLLKATTVPLSNCSHAARRSTLQLRTNLETKLTDGLAVIIRSLTSYRAGQLDVVYTEVVALPTVLVCGSSYIVMLFTYSALAILILVSISKKAFAN